MDYTEHFLDYTDHFVDYTEHFVNGLMKYVTMIHTFGLKSTPNESNSFSDIDIETSWFCPKKYLISFT